MLVRIVLFLGISLIVLAGGAAGWQYWQSLPASGAAVASSAEDAVVDPNLPPAPKLAVVGQIAQTEGPAQNWLISPGGGLVDRDSVRAYLDQGRFTEKRMVTMTFRAPLSALLAEGEALPALPYRAVFANIRAKVLAQKLCDPLVAGWAAACAVLHARSNGESLDDTGETAEFLFQLVYTVKADAAPLPDLSTRILQNEPVGLNAADLGEGGASPEAFLAAAVAAAAQTCTGRGEHCRVTSMFLAWEGPGKGSAALSLSWLAPLPKGMYPAPPLAAAPES